MERSDFQKEENYQEYERLLLDAAYQDVQFDADSGGMSAVHVEHCFDKQIGPFGYRRGRYELDVLDVFRKKGFRITLESEKSEMNVKHTDGYLNDIPMDIKTIESTGRWTLRTKFYEAAKQGAACVVLYFPRRHLYSEERLRLGWEKFVTDPNSADLIDNIQHLIVVVEKDILHL